MEHLIVDFDESGAWSETDEHVYFFSRFDKPHLSKQELVNLNDSDGFYSPLSQPPQKVYISAFMYTYG